MLNELSKLIHKDNKDKGFWDDKYVILDTIANEEHKSMVDKAFRGQRLALMHSELSEALEADRKDLKDDKLPEYDGFAVELADCLIRILDAAGAYGVDLDTVVEKKLAYNRSRPYKHGKKY